MPWQFLGIHQKRGRPLRTTTEYMVDRKIEIFERRQLDADHRDSRAESQMTMDIQTRKLTCDSGEFVAYNRITGTSLSLILQACYVCCVHNRLSIRQVY